MPLWVTRLVKHQVHTVQIAGRAIVSMHLADYPVALSAAASYKLFACMDGCMFVALVIKSDAALAFDSTDIGHQSLQPQSISR
jgi:hypothetical protein